MHIIFYGLKRSGNHAIIHWILQNIGPCKETMPSYIHKGTNVIFFNDVLASSSVIANEVDNCDKEHILASVEDVYTENLITDKIMKNPLRIFILRNPLNCYASRLKTFYESNYIEYPVESFATLYNNFVSNIGRDSFIIDYDIWNSDRSYRDEISQRLGLCNLDICPKTKEGGTSWGDEKYNDRYKYLPLQIQQSLISRIVPNEIAKESTRKIP